jgi:hypothetical protein
LRPTWVRKKKWVYGDVGFTIRASDNVLSKSPFAEDANYSIEVSYAGGISIHAKGLYFSLEKGKPIPRFDRLEIQDNAKTFALKHLGQLLPHSRSG